MTLRVLVAIDDLESSLGIEAVLRQLSLPSDCVIRVLHAIEPLQAIEAWPSEQYRKEAEEMLREFCQRVRSWFPGCDVEQVLVEGAAKEEIVDAATTWPADLVVVGSHGKGQISRFLLGSVSSTVAALSPCPVLISRSRAALASENRARSAAGQNS